MTLTGSLWVSPDGSVSPTPMAHYRATADMGSGGKGFGDGGRGMVS